MGSLRVTDVVLRIGPDAAIVWTLANFPTGPSCTGSPQHHTPVICCILRSITLGWQRFCCSCLSALQIFWL